MPDPEGRPIVYLAGPDVFYPKAEEIAEEKKRLLAARGLLGRFPLDTQLDPAAYSDQTAFALAIARANEAMMREADMILANIEPWRGPEADDGTSYEIGVMAALGKLIVLYTNDERSFAERVRNDVYGGDTYRDGLHERGRRDHMMVEDFADFADNIMLINAAMVSAENALGTQQDAVTIVQRDFETAADFAKLIWEASRM